MKVAIGFHYLETKCWISHNPRESLYWYTVNLCLKGKCASHTDKNHFISRLTPTRLVSRCMKSYKVVGFHTSWDLRSWKRIFFANMLRLCGVNLETTLPVKHIWWDRSGVKDSRKNGCPSPDSHFQQNKQRKPRSRRFCHTSWTGLNMLWVFFRIAVSSKYSLKFLPTCELLPMF